MTKVLKHAEAITRYRDHALVDIALVTSLLDLLQPQRKHLNIRLFRVSEERDHLQVELTAWNQGATVEFADWNGPVTLPDLLYRSIELQVLHTDMVKEKGRGTMHYCWFPIVHEKTPLACLEIAANRPLTVQLLSLIDGMLGLYRNYLSLLQYSQVDTLTRLLNRKTFEDSLQKLLRSNEGTPITPKSQERRSEEEQNDDWLAIFDIDHFKQVNDHYGHLFGDEVLLIMSDIMRQVFRRRDKLFRFGGEEFIVILRRTSEKNALKVMERFRHSVANHRFPQIERVTVSLGLTRILPGDSPTTVLGRADEALYYAKQNGRNQLHYYEALAAQGKIPLQVVNTEAELF